VKREENARKNEALRRGEENQHFGLKVREGRKKVDILRTARKGKGDNGSLD